MLFRSGLIDGGLYFGRPIIDSFAVVEVEGLDEVPVYLGSNLVGQTGSRGTLTAPELISYTDNQISIRPSDLPIDYEWSGKRRVVEMGQRGGARIHFKAFRFTAVEGNIFRFAPEGGQVPMSTLPLEYEIDGEWKTSFTGQHGYFYIENLPPGDHLLRVHGANGVCQATIAVSDSEAIVDAVGDVVCEPVETEK